MEAKGGYRMVISAIALKNDYSDAKPTVQFAKLPKDDVKWCTVSLSDVVKTNKRLEATVFNIEGKQAREIIANCKWESIPLYGTDGLSTAYTCSRFKRIWLKSSDLPIYQPSSITDIKPTPGGYISHKTKVDFEALRVHKGQILLTCSGTIGKVALVSDTLDNKIFSHDLIRIDIKNSIDIGFLYAFLRSKTGNTILQTNRYGAVVQHIEPDHLSDIPIPNPDDKIKRRINDLIMRSFVLRDESNDLIDQATTLLVDELHFPPINEFETARFDKGTDLNNYNVKLSQLSGRLDGSYHIPLVEAITDHLREHSAEVTTVGDKRISKNIILPGRFKRVYVEEGQGQVFFSGKDIMELDPSDKKYLSFSKHNKRIKEQLTIHHGMILVTCSGTVGKATIVPKHWDGWAMTHDILRLVPQEGIDGYLYIWLQSPFACKIIEAMSYGSVVQHIEIAHITEVPVPILKNNEVQTEINKLALKANAMRYEAYKLEQEAMNIMNNEVLFA